MEVFRLVWDNGNSASDVYTTNATKKSIREIIDYVQKADPDEYGEDDVIKELRRREYIVNRFEVTDFEF